MGIKTDDYGRLVFFETLWVKTLKTVTLIIISIIVYFIVQQFDNFEAWRNAGYFQIAIFFGLFMMVFIWKGSSVSFDEMMQVFIIKRGFGKFLPAKQIYYSEIQNIVLKRFGYQDEDGNVSNQGCFHLRLNNGKTHLIMVFNHAESIEDARKNIAKHSKLKIIFI